MVNKNSNTTSRIHSLQTQLDKEQLYLQPNAFKANIRYKIFTPSFIPDNWPHQNTQPLLFCPSQNDVYPKAPVHSLRETVTWRKGNREKKIYLAVFNLLEKQTKILPNKYKKADVTQHNIRVITLQTQEKKHLSVKGQIYTVFRWMLLFIPAGWYSVFLFPFEVSTVKCH